MAKKNVETKEKGNIFFFYRPKIDIKGDITGPDDIQNFYCVLSSKGDKHYRLIIIGREHLPSISKKEKFWGFVVKSSKNKKQIVEELQSHVYETKTRGTRQEPAARPCGEGIYRIVKHGDHTHLVYVLELPKKPEKVQKALKIQEEGSYIISVKNPEKGQPKNAGLSKDQKAKFPKRLQGKFENKKFLPLDPADFLNYEHAELMFIGAKIDVKKELGIELKPEKETESKADVFKDLNLDKKEYLIEPLFEGKWS